MNEQPEQLDQQVAMAINAIRVETRRARARLGLDDRLYSTVTAATIHRRRSCRKCAGYGSGRHTASGPLVDCPECS